MLFYLDLMPVCLRFTNMFNEVLAKGYRMKTTMNNVLFVGLITEKMLENLHVKAKLDDKHTKYTHIDVLYTWHESEPSLFFHTSLKL